MAGFRAFRVEKTEDRQFPRRIVERDTADLPAGDLLIEVAYSSLNYKDALSATGNPGVTRSFPHTPGIDAAGTVLESASEAFAPGDAVIASGYDLGMNTAGGFAQRIRIPAGWAVPMPAGLDARSSMILGTAGFTAGLSVRKLEEPRGCGPRAARCSSPALPAASDRWRSSCSRASATRCTRSPGRGRSTTSCAAWARGRSSRARRRGRGRSGRSSEADVGRRHRHRRRTRSSSTPSRPCATGRAPQPAAWSPRRRSRPPSSRSSCATSTCSGIDSVELPLARKAAIWERLAGPWRLDGLEDLAVPLTLDALSDAIDRILAGDMVGRGLVELGA